MCLEADMISALPLKLKFLLILTSIHLERKSKDLGWLQRFKSTEKNLIHWYWVSKSNREKLLSVLKSTKSEFQSFSKMILFTYSTDI